MKGDVRDFILWAATGASVFNPSPSHIRTRFWLYGRQPLLVISVFEPKYIPSISSYLFSSVTVSSNGSGKWTLCIHLKFQIPQSWDHLTGSCGYFTRLIAGVISNFIRFSGWHCLWYSSLTADSKLMIAGLILVKSKIHRLPTLKCDSATTAWTFIA